ncbi:MAG: class I SAM-dependent methyltransferase [bacterium]|nr:class I SAM-dependent methyltransferase [bacterium]
MKLTPEEELTVKSYEEKGETWARAHNKPGFWIEEMKKLYASVPSHRLIEFGCGGGRDAKQLIDIGFDYMGTDISATFLKEAKKNNPGATFTQMSLYDIPYKESSFDCFWALAVLLHIPKRRVDEALQNYS